MSADPIEQLNTECFCVTVDAAALRHELDADAATRGLYDRLRETHAYLFAHAPIFVSRANVSTMARLVAAVDAVVALPAYREAALSRAPEIARFEPGPLGGLLGFDFHVTPQGPRLIEINTNPGGAFLNAALARAQRACCAPVLSLLGQPGDGADLQDALFAAFLSEWRRQRGDAPLRRVAIVDESPSSQYLYPEFLLAAELFRRRGVEATICDPGELSLGSEGLQQDGRPVDLVYNRLTDFSLGEPAHAPLREAYLAAAAVVTPHPRAHALYADKRNLALLGDAERLRQWGADPATIETLQLVIPPTRVVERAAADELWGRRRELFFKPATGFGSRAAYRGDKLTRRVWEEILSGDYVAQQFVPPSARGVQVDGRIERLKLDLRCYVHDGQLLSVAARLYQGQTTNFRTPGGGFAAVLCPP
jgi:glutathione synthase/RimK-type ligase-like ATP-grasp enzyme